MASTIKVDKIEGSTGSTVTVPTGQTLTVTDGIPVASGGTGIASFTAGDLLYATGATTLVKLAKGTGRQGLQTNSGATAPEWTNSPQSLMTAAGDILYASGANTLAKLAKGSDTEVLTLASGVPSWAATAAGGLVLQVLSINTSAQQSTTTSAYADSALTLDITPASASNKILVLCNIGEIVKSGGDTSVNNKILRDAVSICQTSNCNSSSSADRRVGSASFAVLDSPATTSATTYKVQIANSNPGVGTSYMNYNSSTNVSQLTLMEISA